MARTNDGIELFRQVLTQELREHWMLFLIEGIVLVILGVLAILMPMIATIPVAIVIGWLILISGVVGLVTTSMARDVPGFWWSVVSGLVCVVAGIMLLGGPILAEVSLTLLLVVFFTIEGMAWSIYAMQYKKELSGPWTWMLMSGIVDLILAFMFWCRLPGTAVWAFGPLVGISMLFGGASMIAMAVHAHAASQPNGSLLT